MARLRVTEAQAEALKEAAEGVFDSLLKKARNFGDGIDTEFQRLLRKKPKPKPEPIPDQKVPPTGGGVKEKGEELGDSNHVLRFSDAMEAVRAVLAGEPALKGETRQETAVRLRREANEANKGMTVLENVLYRIKIMDEIGREIYGDPSETTQLKKIETRMKRYLLSQKSRRKKVEKKTRVRKW